LLDPRVKPEGDELCLLDPGFHRGDGWCVWQSSSWACRRTRINGLAFAAFMVRQAHHEASG